MGGHPTVEAWSRGDVLFEHFHYPPGGPGVIERHAHAHYQWCLSIDTAGEYRYRGARHHVPVGGLSMLHPGEPHSVHDRERRPTAANFLVMSVPVDVVEGLATELTGRRVREPFFSHPILKDASLAGRFARAHSTARRPDAGIEHEVLVRSAFAHALAEHADLREGGSRITTRHEPAAVATVVEYLRQNVAAPIRLGELAGLVELSPEHLNRAFSRTVGVPPHRYQLLLRIDRAKALLASSASIADVAAETGFADQSHLARHFKRFVGVSPGRYRPYVKNVQDRAHSPG